MLLNTFLLRQVSTQRLKCDIKMLNAIRRETGASWLICQKALQDSNNDLNVARQAIRTLVDAKAKTICSGAQNLHEGLVGIFRNNSRLCILKLACETDFVSKSPVFASLMEKLAFRRLNQSHVPDKVINEDEKDIFETSVSVNESIVVADVDVVEISPERYYGTYIHNRIHSFAGSIACVVELKGSDPSNDMANKFARHIAGLAPSSVMELENQPFLFGTDGKTVSDTLILHGCSISRFKRFSMK